MRLLCTAFPRLIAVSRLPNRWGALLTYFQCKAQGEGLSSWQRRLNILRAEVDLCSCNQCPAGWANATKERRLVFSPGVSSI